MRRFRKLLCMVLLMGLVIPGYALGAGYYTFEGPPQVPVGRDFTVNVYLTYAYDGLQTDLATICGLQYALQYPVDLATLNPQEIACSEAINDCNPDGFFCIIQPLVDGGFFQAAPRTCVNCTAPLNPIGGNCVPPNCDPAQVDFVVQVFSPYDLPIPGVCFKDVVAKPINRQLVSQLTFRAVAPGSFRLAAIEGYNLVTDCIIDPEPKEDALLIDGQTIQIVEASLVPAMTNVGLGVFALLLAGTFIVMARRQRRGRILVFLLALALAGGLIVGKTVLAADCPDYCSNGNADVNKDGRIIVSDAQIVLSCANAGCGNTAYDVTGTGAVDMEDYAAVMNCIQKRCGVK